MEQKHDYSNVQEAKYIDMAKDNAKKTSCSVQNNETIKLVLYGYRSQRNINNAMKINSTYVWSNLVAVPVLFSIITYLFYRGNTDAYDYVDTYLKQSKVIKLTIPQKYERKSEFYSFRFGKNGNRKYNQFIF